MIRGVSILISLMMIWATESCEGYIDQFRKQEPEPEPPPPKTAVLSPLYYPEGYEPPVVINGLIEDGEPLVAEETEIDETEIEGRLTYHPVIGESWSGGPWDESPNFKQGIRKAYEWLDLEDEYAISDLLDALQHEDSHVRERAAGVLGLVGSVNDEIIPALINAFNDSSSSVRAKAGRALAKIGEEALPYLLDASESDVAIVRATALHSMRWLLKNTEINASIFSNALWDRSREVRSEAMHGLDAMDSGAIPVIPDIVGVLEDENLWNRHAAAQSLGNLGVAARDAMPVLVQYVLDKPYLMRDEVGSAIGKIHNQARLDIIELTEEIGLGDIFGPQYESKYIYDVILDNEEDVQKLVGFLENGSLVQQCLAADILGRTVPESVSAIPALRLALLNENEWVRIYAIDALGQMGGSAIHTKYDLELMTDSTVATDRVIRHARLAIAKTMGLDELEKMLLDDDEWLVIHAANALGDKGTLAMDAAGKLIPLLDSESWPVRMAAAFALDDIGFPTPEAMDVYLDVLRYGENSQMGETAEALKKIGPESVQPLIKMLRDPVKQGRSYAAWVLGVMGEMAADAVPALIIAMMDQSRGSRTRAIKSIGQICSHPELSVPALLEVLDDESMMMKYMVVDALGCFGPEGVEALPRLEMALAGGNGRTRVSAALAVYRIDPAAIDVVPFLLNELGKPYYPWEDMDTSIDMATRLDAAPLSAARALGELGPMAADAVPKLIEMLGHDEFYMQWAAADGVAGIGPAAYEAIPVLTEMLDNTEGRLYESVVKALAAIDPDNPQE